MTPPLSPNALTDRRSAAFSARAAFAGTQRAWTSRRSFSRVHRRAHDRCSLRVAAGHRYIPRVIERRRDPAAPTLIGSAMDDRQILEGVRRADPRAFGALHDRVRPLVDKTLVRLLGRKDHEHDDLAQLALVEIVTSLQRFRGDCSLDTWVARIAARVVYDQFARRKSARRVFSTDPSDDVDAASRANPERDVALRGLLGRVRAHLDTLEPNKAWTLMLHDVCGYDLREIADITGSSIAAAQTRLSRGRRELRALVEGDPELASQVHATHVNATKEERDD
ncbi:MAG: RNA polymerase sigma factor [Polyangiales bacterium]